MRIIWISSPTEIEADIHRAQYETPDLVVDQFSVAHPEGAADGATRNAGSTIAQPYWRGGIRNVASPYGDLLQRISEEDADLFVFRFPFWLQTYGQTELFHKLFAARPVVAWCSEQGVMLPEAMRTVEAFDCVAVNHEADRARYQDAFPSKRIFVMPSGTVRWRDDELVSDVPRTFFLADGRCHYSCTVHPWRDKQESVEALVLPLLEDHEDIALYGIENDDCGWKDVPGAQRAFRGQYPADQIAQIYSAAQVYLGISWNWQTSGYGIKLARALGTGICTIWHRTPAMQLDGLVEGEHLFCSSSPTETRQLAEMLKNDPKLRQKVGAAGRAFANARWHWGDNLVQLAREVCKREESHVRACP